MRDRVSVCPLLCGGRLFGAFACEAGFAFAGARVAEGFVEGAVTDIQFHPHDTRDLGDGLKVTFYEHAR